MSPIKYPLDHHLRNAVEGHQQIQALVAEHAERDRSRQAQIEALASDADLAGS